MTLACEDANSKHVDVDIVADVSDEDRGSWKLRFGHETKLLFRL